VTSRVTFAGGKNSDYCFKWKRGNLLYKLVSSTNLVVPKKCIGSLRSICSYFIYVDSHGLLNLNCAALITAVTKLGFGAIDSANLKKFTLNQLHLLAK
jgi:hypothetical protein